MAGVRRVRSGTACARRHHRGHFRRLDEQFRAGKDWEKGSAFIFFFSRKEEKPVFLYSIKIPMVQHGAVLQDDSYTRLHQHRLHQHRLASSSCYNFQKNGRIAYLLLYSSVLNEQKDQKLDFCICSIWQFNFPIPICPT